MNKASAAEATHLFSKSQFNYYGTYSLATREVKRFFAVYNQTIVAPIVTALIFLAIFSLALDNPGKKIHNVPFLDFISYGLIIMTVIQNSFGNSQSSLIMAKVLGYVGDILMTPFDGLEILCAYTIGSVVRGVIVGAILAFILSFIVEIRFHNIPATIFYVLIASILLSFLGTLSALITDTFDQSSSVTNYVITPLSFLSGTFYSVHSLPVWVQWINSLNPFFYIIDGFRYSLIGTADGNIYFGIAYLIFITFVVGLVTVRIIDSGWRLKP